MTVMQNDAIRKITEQKGMKITEPRRQFMVTYIADAICGFIEQSPEFAAAVMAEGKDLIGCVNSLNIQNPNYLSDADAYAAAARYFFPDAVVECKLTIRSIKKQTSKILDINLEDFLK